MLFNFHRHRAPFDANHLNILFFQLHLVINNHNLRMGCREKPCMRLKILILLFESSSESLMANDEYVCANCEDSIIFIFFYVDYLCIFHSLDVVHERKIASLYLCRRFFPRWYCSLWSNSIRIMLLNRAITWIIMRRRKTMTKGNWRSKQKESRIMGIVDGDNAGVYGNVKGNPPNEQEHMN